MKQQEKCFFCLKPVIPEEDMVEIMQLPMCPDCEKRLLLLPVGGQEYDLFKDKIKKILFS